MFRNRILKILALLMVLNILIIPLTTFTPQQQNKYKVYAAEGIVDIRFFNAVISMIGITAAGLATMSPSFSIPEADLIEMKNNFAQSLEADAVKKQAWLAAQTDYLSGGVAKTMGAVELAKIGINDVYDEFMNYIKEQIPNEILSTDGTTDILINGDWKKETTLYNPTGYLSVQKSMQNYKVLGYNTETIKLFRTVNEAGTFITGTSFMVRYIYIPSGDVRCSIQVMATSPYWAEVTILMNSFSSVYNNNRMIIEASKFGINLKDYYPQLTSINTSGVIGSATYNDTGNIINTTENTRSFVPTIPWFDPSIPIGTVVTPAISAPYAGAVPIDVPITAPIDPPIDIPDNPPADTTLLGTVAAILAGLTPIAGFLEYILAGQVSLTDAIEAGITGVIDGIGDIAGTLTDGITSSLTDIQTSIGSLLDPPTETLDMDKLKNLNSVLFTKFPFSIPFDFIAIVSAINADPVAPVLTIPFNMQDFGGSNSNVEIDLSIYDNFANIARQIGFIGFVIFMLFNTRKLIWK